jgi:hypothetical protein
MKKPSKKVDDPRKIFEHAERFRWTDIHLRLHRDQQVLPMILLPAMMLSAFASELYLKCLHRIDGNEMMESHSLQELYQALQPLRQKRIETLWNALMIEQKPLLDIIDQTAKFQKYTRDLTTALKDSDQSFVRLRYEYEDRNFKFYLGDFPTVLRTTILEIQPSWSTPLPLPQAGLLL